MLLIPLDIIEGWLYLTSKCRDQCCPDRGDHVARSSAELSKYAQRDKRLQALYGDQFKWWNQLNEVRVRVRARDRVRVRVRVGVRVRVRVS